MPPGNTEKAEGGHFVRQGAPRHDARRGCIPTWCVAGYYLPRTSPRISHVSRCPPKPCHVSSSTPPPCMAGFCAFAPPCMVAGPNGLVLKILSKTDQIWNMFQIWAKNKNKITSVGYRTGIGFDFNMHACMHALISPKIVLFPFTWTPSNRIQPQHILLLGARDIPPHVGDTTTACRSDPSLTGDVRHASSPWDPRRHFLKLRWFGIGHTS